MAVPGASAPIAIMGYAFRQYKAISAKIRHSNAALPQPEGQGLRDRAKHLASALPGNRGHHFLKTKKTAPIMNMKPTI